MIDKIGLKQTLYVFHKEASRLLRSKFEESPLPFQRLLRHIESDPIIREYIDDCVSFHTPEGFSAKTQCDETAGEYCGVFGPFSPDPQEESAEVYLILKELVIQNAQGRSNFFTGYGAGSRKWQEKYQDFLDSVARRLIDNIECHLSIIGIEAGLDDTGDTMTNNFYAPIGNAQINQPSGQSVVNASQDNGVDLQELERILNDILGAARNDLIEGEALEDIEETLDSIREQMTSDKPKRGVIRGSVSLLKGINASVQFSAALAALIEFLSNHGITFAF